MTTGKFPPESQFGTLEYWRERCKKAEVRIAHLEKVMEDVTAVLHEVNDREMDRMEKEASEA